MILNPFYLWAAGQVVEYHLFESESRGIEYFIWYFRILVFYENLILLYPINVSNELINLIGIMVQPLGL